MEFDDRLSYIALGCVLGFVLGYLTRMMTEIKKTVEETKEEVDDIDAILKRRRGEDGFMRHPFIADIMMLLVLAMCVWASFSTQKTNNELQQQSEKLAAQNVRLEKISQCTLEFTSKTIRALNERTTYTQEQADANIKVVKAQSDLFKLILVLPPVTREVVRARLESYVDKLDHFDVVAGKNKAKTQTYAYPTNEELASCLGVQLPDVETGEENVK